MGSVFGKVPQHCQGGFVFVTFCLWLCLCLCLCSGFILRRVLGKVSQSCAGDGNTRKEALGRREINSTNYSPGIIKSYKCLHSKEDSLFEGISKWWLWFITLYLMAFDVHQDTSSHPLHYFNYLVLILLFLTRIFLKQNNTIHLHFPWINLTNVQNEERGVLRW